MSAADIKTHTFNFFIDNIRHPNNDNVHFLHFHSILAFMYDIWLMKCKNNGKSHSLKAQGDIIKSLVLSNQQPQTTKYSIFYHTPQTKAANLNSWEGDSNQCQIILLDKNSGLFVVFTYFRSFISPVIHIYYLYK